VHSRSRKDRRRKTMIEAVMMPAFVAVLSWLEVGGEETEDGAGGCMVGSWVDWCGEPSGENSASKADVLWAVGVAGDGAAVTVADGDARIGARKGEVCADIVEVL
jgi:hypothetical protein